MHVCKSLLLGVHFGFFPLARQLNSRYFGEEGGGMRGCFVGFFDGSPVSKTLVLGPGPELEVFSCGA